MRKGKEMKNGRLRRLMILSGIVMLMSIIVYGGICVVHADSLREKSRRVKYYTTIEIQYGDTLWSIAEQYKSGRDMSTEAYMRELMDMNHLKEDRIIAGDRLLVFYYKDAVSGRAAAAASGKREEFHNAPLPEILLPEITRN